MRVCPRARVRAYACLCVPARRYSAPLRRESCFERRHTSRTRYCHAIVARVVSQLLTAHVAPHVVPCTPSTTLVPTVVSCHAIVARVVRQFLMAHVVPHVVPCTSSTSPVPTVVSCWAAGPFVGRGRGGGRGRACRRCATWQAFASSVRPCRAVARTTVRSNRSASPRRRRASRTRR